MYFTLVIYVCVRAHVRAHTHTHGVSYTHGVWVVCVCEYAWHIFTHDRISLDIEHACLFVFDTLVSEKCLGVPEENRFN